MLKTAKNTNKERLPMYEHDTDNKNDIMFIEFVRSLLAPFWHRNTKVNLSVQPRNTNKIPIIGTTLHAIYIYYGYNVRKPPLGVPYYYTQRQWKHWVIHHNMKQCTPKYYLTDRGKPRTLQNKYNKLVVIRTWVYIANNTKIIHFVPKFYITIKKIL